MPAERRSIALVKLGGSLLTDKKRAAKARPEVIRRLAEELVRARSRMPEDLILGHGSGSFGHVTAERYEITAGFSGAAQLPGITATQRSASDLHRQVLAALADAGGAPFSIAPSSSLVARSGRPSRVFYEPLLSALALGLLPVLYGDVVMDHVQGVAIVSTETVFFHIVRRLAQRRQRVSRALWVGQTAGVHDADGATVPRIAGANLREVLTGLSGAAGTDVTGGMRHRVESAWALARSGVPSLLIDGTQPGILERALAGEDVPGTWVEV